MSRSWQLQEAKNKFSNLVERAQKEGPQIVTKHGKETVIILSVEDYKKITKPKLNLFEFIQNSPFAGIELDVFRDKSFARNVEI